MRLAPWTGGALGYLVPLMSALGAPQALSRAPRLLLTALENGVIDEPAAEKPHTFMRVRHIAGIFAILPENPA